VCRSLGVAGTESVGVVVFERIATTEWAGEIAFALEPEAWGGAAEKLLANSERVLRSAGVDIASGGELAVKEAGERGAGNLKLLRGVGCLLVFRLKGEGRSIGTAERLSCAVRLIDGWRRGWMATNLLEGPAAERLAIGVGVDDFE
jgi:hypothetical protein